jgi:hypothetical protein
LREEHRRGRRDNGYELFAILIFDAWYRKYITRTMKREFEISDSRFETARASATENR